MQIAWETWFDSYDEDAAANDDCEAPPPRSRKRGAWLVVGIVVVTVVLLWLGI